MFVECGDHFFAVLYNVYSVQGRAAPYPEQLPRAALVDVAPEMENWDVQPTLKTMQLAKLISKTVVS